MSSAQDCRTNSNPCVDRRLETFRQAQIGKMECLWKPEGMEAFDRRREGEGGRSKIAYLRERPHPLDFARDSR